jgi:glycerate kinase
VTLRRVVVAPDKFKGSLSALEASVAIERGLRAAMPGALEIARIPMADGGEGTVDAFLASGAERIVRTVRGPLGKPVEAAFALDGKTAIVEMAAASGLELIAPGRRAISRATTYGTGELLVAALDAGAQRLVIGIGGSATSDGGAGMLQALGVRLLDLAGHELSPGGAALAGLSTIDLTHLDARIAKTKIEVAADVDNPLCGPRGASVVFGPQKGASESDVRALDVALAHFADVAARALGADRRNDPGAGAAGGLGFALLAFLAAGLRPGVDIVAELRGLPDALRGAEAVFTGEGRIDEQTLHGKTVAGVARLARAAGVKTIVAFGGSIDSAAAGALRALGVSAIGIAADTMPREAAMRDANALLEAAAKRIARSVLPG